MGKNTVNSLAQRKVLQIFLKAVWVSKTSEMYTLILRPIKINIYLFTKHLILTFSMLLSYSAELHLQVFWIKLILQV
jgi:hypothetical protein